MAKGWDFTIVDGTRYTGGIFVNETWLTDAVANVGPISACLYTSDKFSSYKGGKFMFRCHLSQLKFKKNFNVYLKVSLVNLNVA
jgi:hypothetical protein